MDNIENRNLKWNELIVCAILVGGMFASASASAQLKDSSGAANYFMGNVGIGTTTPAVALDVSPATDAVTLPGGSNAQRPTAANGILRFNTTGSGSLEAYYNSTWNTLSAGIGGGGTGTTTAFTQGSVVYAGAGGVYSQNNSKLFWDATNHRLGIGTASPAVALDLRSNTDAMTVPKGTTAQRPASPAPGMLRYNSTLKSVEGYQGVNPMWGMIRGTVARMDLLHQNASVAATPLFTATNAGNYMFCIFFQVNNRATTGSMRAGVRAIYDIGGGALNFFATGLISTTSNGNCTGGCVTANIVAGSSVDYVVEVNGVEGALDYNSYWRIYELR